MSSALFLVFRNPGPSWVPGLTSRQQPLWEEHAIFMDRLFAEGRVVLGGPYADYSRILLVIQARDADEASSLLLDDPWAASGILVPSEVIEWTILTPGEVPDETSRGCGGPGGIFSDCRRSLAMEGDQAPCVGRARLRVISDVTAE